MTGAQTEEGDNSEEVSSRYTEMLSHHDIDAIKQNRGLLSFRSRKMLNLFHKSGGAAQVEKKISGPVSARDVKLEVIANPPEQLSVESQKEETKNKVPELKKTVRTVVTRNGSSLQHCGLKDRENVKPQRANNRSPQRLATDEQAQTPQKKKQLLPARLKLLETFYEGLEAAISLLAIRRQMCTFKSVCKTVEQMSKRRFLRAHLAQMKFLFPEVIEIDYARVPDQDSRRDVWDLRITLKSYVALPGGSPLKGAASPSRDKNAQTLRRKKEFHSRLLKFARSHNEDVDVPQGPLPQRPLGGLSSPNVTAEPPTSNGGDNKQSTERNLDAPSPVDEADHNEVTEISNAEEAKLPMAHESEVYEFCIVKPGPVSFPDIDITSHFPPSFRPHFRERRRELISAKTSDTLDSLHFGKTSHFAPSFRPQFQERRQELLSQSKNSSSTFPSEVHLRTSATSSGIITHVSSAFISHVSKPLEECSGEDFSQPSESAERQENSLQFSASLSEPASSRSLMTEWNADTSARGEKNAADAGETSTSESAVVVGHLPHLSAGHPQTKEVPTTFLAGQSPVNGISGKGASASTPAEETPSKSTAVLSPFSKMTAEMAQDSPLFPSSVLCATPGPSTSGTSDSVPNTPYTSRISSYDSPAVAHTPASLSPSRRYQYVQDPLISENLKKTEASPSHPAPVKSQGTMRSLKFGSPLRPPRPLQRQAEVFAPTTPQVGAPLEATPRDESKYAPTQSSFHTPQATTPEACLESSSYFSPVRPQRSRALRFSTPEKIHDSDASVPKLGTPSSSEQQFKSPENTMKPPRFMSPPKAQTPGAPATPVPATPARSILYSPPKRVKFNRGSLFSDAEQQEEVQVHLHHTLVPDSEKAEASTGVLGETADLQLSSNTSPLEETCSTPVKDSPSKTRKALKYVSKADLAIIDCLPAELVQSVREKERKINDESTKELMLQKRRQQMIAGLPKMFNQLRMIFQSLKRSVLPRHELLKNVLSTNADVTDRGEVEERLKLLIEIAPDWISKQPSSNGDYIYRINKSTNVTMIQKKILEAC